MKIQRLPFLISAVLMVALLVPAVPGWTSASALAPFSYYLSHPCTLVPNKTAAAALSLKSYREVSITSTAKRGHTCNYNAYDNTGSNDQSVVMTVGFLKVAPQAAENAIIRGDEQATALSNSAEVFSEPSLGKAAFCAVGLYTETDGAGVQASGGSGWTLVVYANPPFLNSGAVPQCATGITVIKAGLGAVGAHNTPAPGPSKLLYPRSTSPHTAMTEPTQPPATPPTSGSTGPVSIPDPCELASPRLIAAVLGVSVTKLSPHYANSTGSSYLEMRSCSWTTIAADLAIRITTVSALRPGIPYGSTEVSHPGGLGPNGVLYHYGQTPAWDIELDRGGYTSQLTATQVSSSAPLVALARSIWAELPG